MFHGFENILKVVEQRIVFLENISIFFRFKFIDGDGFTITILPLVPK
jgi:hypothetical protein